MSAPWYPTTAATGSTTTGSQDERPQLTLGVPATFSNIPKNLCRGATSDRIVTLFSRGVDSVRQIGGPKLFNRDRAEDVIAERVRRTSDNRLLAFLAIVEKR